MDGTPRLRVPERDEIHPLDGPRAVRREYLRWALAAGDRDVVARLTFAMVWLGSPRRPLGPQ